MSPRHFRAIVAFPAAGLLSFATALPASPTPLEELVVTAEHDRRTIDIDSATVAPDLSRALQKAPGGNVNSNGPLTGIVQYRGMYGPRIATAVDGVQVAPAGPNWMDPPLSYATGHIESLVLYRGIAPVSVAQESIGGAVEVTTASGEFNAGRTPRISGRLGIGGQSVNNGSSVAAALYASARDQRIKLAADMHRGDDAEFPGGDIIPTEYERRRYAVEYAVRTHLGILEFDYSYLDTGETGTPSLPMDIDYIEGDLFGIRYTGTLAGGLELSARLYGSKLDHGMTNYHLRAAPAPAMWRRNITASDNAGFKIALSGSHGDNTWTVGADGFRAEHESDIDNPEAPMFFVTGFDDVKRTVRGVFAEYRWNAGDDLEVELGARYNCVDSEAGEVDGTPARLMPPAAMLRDAFNAADRSVSDDNLDLVARGWYRLNPALSLYAGVARKTRSPSYQERYLWLPLEATGGLADGLTYTGNIDLDPEVSHQVEVGLDFSNGGWTFSPRLFYHDVDDYIQGTPSDVAPAIMVVAMMQGPDAPTPLRFSNVDARLYGFDMDWHWRIDTHWRLSGVVNYVRGERRDIDDDLYRIAPPNTSIALQYRAGNWSAMLEGVLYAEQSNVSRTNNERKTSSYGLLNLRTDWQPRENISLTLGIDNLLDERYREHLGGYNRAANPDIAIGQRLPGQGINLFGRAEYRF